MTKSCGCTAPGTYCKSVGCTTCPIRRATETRKIPMPEDRIIKVLSSSIVEEPKDMTQSQYDKILEGLSVPMPKREPPGMGIKEFKQYIAGFSLAVVGAPNEAQWEALKKLIERLAE